MNSTSHARPVTASLDDPFYYLANFRFVLAWVAERYDDLLGESELTFIETFNALPKPSQALLVRMVMRKGKRFRSGKLRYAEIGNTEAALLPLIEGSWVEIDPVVDLESLFTLLTKAEIVEALKHDIAMAGLTAGSGKAVLREALVSCRLEPRPLTAWWPQAPDRVVELNVMETCERLRLMFFGNLRQDWAEFVLAELGLQRFEAVEFSRESRAFQTREEVDAYLNLHRLRERLEEGELPRVLCSEVPAVPANPWLEARRARLLFQLAREAERRDDMATALAIYPDCGHPEARVRHLRLLERRGEFEAAHRLAECAMQAPGSEAERQALARLLPRVRRRLGLPPPPKTVPASIERLDLCLSQPVMGGVEAAVCEHLSSERAPVRYVENTLIGGLFGLLCWEAIFAPLPGAFFHPFHTGPADLDREDFVARRRERFAACLAELDDDRYRRTIHETWHAKHGVASPFVHWGVLDEMLLEQALVCLPAVHLRKLFERLLRDLKGNRAGLPDLVQLWPDERRYRLIEVKGPGDRLQDNQCRWLTFFQEHAMPVAVCHVTWRDAAS
ncbi:Fanconi-associated nuclease [Litchfieldella qijiaojingensis]|uniref:phosphodiesterase I n=1 Tax=Litchfieldella qijiaojingensis TaxID=980347 RepID=A0ABQ2YVH6_9GAMM|nr:VRR-NUC domain-containing protein [Halomonas qijiaojingensis]GGX94650.1 Fanconi-associated nuclease [Halomonas qijiaojingensis]